MDNANSDGNAEQEKGGMAGSERTDSGKNGDSSNRTDGIEVVERHTAKAVLLDELGRVLMLKRADDSNHFAGKLDLPGGKVDGENPREGVTREIREETGIGIPPEYLSHKARVVRIYPEWTDGKPRIVVHTYDIYTTRLADSGGDGKPRHGITAKTEKGRIVPELSKEHSDYRWVGMDELEPLMAEFSTGLEGLYILASMLPGYTVATTREYSGTPESGRVHVHYVEIGDGYEKLSFFSNGITGAMEFLSRILEHGPYAAIRKELDRIGEEVAGIERDIKERLWEIFWPWDRYYWPIPAYPLPRVYMRAGNSVMVIG